MSFQSRTDFIDASSSEKLTLAWLEGVERLHNWTLDSGAIYKRSVLHFVVGVAQSVVQLTSVATLGAMVEGSFFYDSATNELSIWTNGSTNPQTAEEMIVKYRFFYGNGPVSASWDLDDASEHVQYEGRIEFSPQYKHKIGITQDLTSLVGNGTLRLSNNDGGLDEIFDTLIFENKEVTVYSWNRDLNFSDAKIIFRGFVTNKVYKNDTVSFKVKDQLFAMEQQIPQTVYGDSDAVNDNVKGGSKRWIYGRVDDSLLQSVDQTEGGVSLTGTGSIIFTQSPKNLTGVGTLFLTECSPGDTLTIGTQEFQIETIESDTQLTLDTDPEFGFSGQSMTIVPSIPLSTKNRIYQVADHACAELTKTVSSVLQFNRVVLSDTIGIRTGDFLEFTTGERIEVKNVAPGNIVVLRQNLILIPAVSSTVTRQPIQTVFVRGKDIQVDNYVITNNTTETKITLAQNTEFELARTEDLNIDLTFTNGSRRVTYAGTEDLKEIIETRDWIRPEALVFTTFYEILSVGDGLSLTGTVTSSINSTTVTGVGTLFNTELSPGDEILIGGESATVDSITSDLILVLDALPDNSATSVSYRLDGANVIELRTAFADANHAGPVEGKLPEYIDDGTIVSANVLGRTNDGTPSGTWLITPADCMRDLINEAGLTQVNETTFTEGSVSIPHLVSLSLPLSPTGGSTTIKTAVDLLARSSFCAVTLDNDLKIKYNVLDIKIPDVFTEIDDSDVYDWSIETTNGKNIESTILKYRHRDADRVTQEESSNSVTYVNDFVTKYVGTTKSEELNIYLYEEFSAKVMASRLSYWNSLSRADMKVTTDLRLENIEIGDTLVVNFRRLYKRFGDSASRKKALTVIGKTINGERTILDLSDLGNLFNRSSIITPNTAPTWLTATEDEKLKYGYITENNGIIDDDEDTANIHLIS